MNAYNSAQSWDISKIMSFFYGGYKTVVIMFTIAGLLGLLWSAYTIATAGENSGKLRSGVLGIVSVAVGMAVLYLAPWLLNVFTTAAQQAAM